MPVLGNSHRLKSGLPPSKPHYLEYRWRSLLAPLWFKWRPSSPKSELSIQLLGSTNVGTSAFGDQLHLSFSASVGRHDASRPLRTPVSTNLDSRNLPRAVFTGTYTLLTT
jgi:hypothetical protein